jgi:Flp pilus assembly pilin Flp
MSVQLFLGDERGQDLVEYSLLIVLIGMLGVLVLAAMGGSFSNILSKITNVVVGADEQIGS